MSRDLALRIDALLPQTQCTKCGFTGCRPYADAIAAGVAETSRPTTHADPSYVEEGVVHCCIANLPAAVPREASELLSAAALPFALRLAGGLKRALRDSDALRGAVLLWQGRVTHEGIARETGLPFAPLDDRDLA